MPCTESNPSPHLQLHTPTSKMLLRFTSTDMLNCSLIDVPSGQRTYIISTVLQPPKPEAEGESDPLGPRAASTSSSSQVSTSQERRHTSITDASGTTLVSIDWAGRQPDITILDENVGGLNGLFGSSTVRFMYVVFSDFYHIYPYIIVGQKSWQSRHGLTQSKCG